jgi:murein DD-endopeptidase MepM/ murein hydrolase activator NlpD
MMESMLRWLGILVLLAAIAAGILYVIAGRGAPPQITVNSPEKVVGQRGTLEITASAPGARFSSLIVTVEQNGMQIPVFTFDPAQDAAAAGIAAVEGDPDTVRIVRPFGKEGVPQLQSGTARIVVHASRPSLLDLRTLSSTATKDVTVRLEPPRVAVLSTHHYVNHGGSEMVVYRVTPADAASGVRVGDLEYPGFPASGAGVAGDSSLRVAFFALLAGQDRDTPIVVFARDEAGNQARSASFVDRVFAKAFRKSRIPLDDRFLQRVVPEILENSPEVKVEAAGELLPAFLKINGDLRQMNADRIASMTAATSPSRLWNGPFVQLGNSQVEAGFADDRTYVFEGRDVDRQTHLGYDLAVTSAIPILAANAGKVLHADWLGIYGNCVVVDHGMGIASLYGHLSSIDVRLGDSVQKGQVLGRSGMTGLAGGDHLHFTMLVHGRPVNPVEWWDSHWIADRIERKLSVRYD